MFLTAAAYYGRLSRRASIALLWSECIALLCSFTLLLHQIKRDRTINGTAAPAMKLKELAGRLLNGSDLHICCMYAGGCTNIAGTGFLCNKLQHHYTELACSAPVQTVLQQLLRQATLKQEGR